MNRSRVLETRKSGLQLRRNLKLIKGEDGFDRGTILRDGEGDRVGL